MRKFLIVLTMVIASIALFAQSGTIVGKWTSVDDETGKPKSIVEIFEKPDGKYYGKISQLLQKPAHDNCIACKDDRKNKPLIGLEIIRGLKKEGDDFTGGTITDPKSGKTYKCTISRSGDRLNVRGYMGISLIGRTQTWTLVK